METPNEYIEVKRARTNNLKSISLKLPRDKLIVITGLSGSGKSSLAYDTLYAEGQRRYVESLSTYARQFLGRINKPPCDYIKGIPPSIAIKQGTITRNPRSTVGTATEIYHYLRLLYARVGRTYSPVSGREVKKNTPDDVVRCMLSRPEGTPLTVLAPLSLPEGDALKVRLQNALKQGYTRLYVDGEIVRIEDILSQSTTRLLQGRPHEICLLIDRLRRSDDKDTLTRLTDSAETAFYEGNGHCILRFEHEDAPVHFSDRYEADGIVFDEPTENLFNFNTPLGACPQCNGIGETIGIDQHKVIPDTTLSIYQDAVMCWRGNSTSRWKDAFCRMASTYDFPIYEPYYRLTANQKDLLWHGPKNKGNDTPCIDNFFKMLHENQYKIQYRVMLARYRGKTVCPKCGGTRLRPEASYVKVGGRTITQLTAMPLTDLQQFFHQLALPANDKETARRLMPEILARLEYLHDVGLGYLTLNRPCNTLSGGETQRVNLATALGSSLVGSLYILDEPSIALHPADTNKLIHALRRLQQLGNTVIVVEHDEEIIRSADHIIDLGPEAGRLGGEVVFEGSITKLLANKDQASKSYTVKYLTGQETIPIPLCPRPHNYSIDIIGACANNLQNIDVSFPLNVLTAVTGVSGSGKSTLVRDVFFRAMQQQLDQTTETPGEYHKLCGDIHMVKAIELVDQHPIGKSSRSNPVTYVKAYDLIRQLFAQQPTAQQMGLTPASFSFNTEGGRCERCKGEGTITIEMQFMADIVIPCPACHGTRFKPEVLEVLFAGRNIADVLDMTVNQAADFFSQHKKEKIAQRLKPLQDVGLGYIKLGQSSSTLSGGENQRVKLAYFLGLEKVMPTIFIFDEPTTGLHVHDVRRLLAAFDALLAHGHSVIVIEHNLDVIKCADYVIDLGPDGGAGGGNVVVCGTPADVAHCPQSRTGLFLKQKLAGRGLRKSPSCEA